MSDSVQPHRRQPTRLHYPWDSPGKNTGVGCHFLLQCMKVKSESEVTQSCPTLRNPMDCSLPGSSVHGIFQARVLEWGAIAFSTIQSKEMQLLLLYFDRRISPHMYTSLFSFCHIKPNCKNGRVVVFLKCITEVQGLFWFYFESDSLDMD